jgi:hypothetical protein
MLPDRSPLLNCRNIPITLKTLNERYGLFSTVIPIYNNPLHMTFRVLVAFFAGITTVITTVLIPVAYFGDKNPRWAARLVIIGFIAALILMVAIFWGV